MKYPSKYPTMGANFANGSKYQTIGAKFGIGSKYPTMGATFDIGSIFLSSFFNLELGGEVWFGVMGSGNEIKAKLFFGFDPVDPTGNYFYGKIEKLTVDDFIKAFNKTISLPGPVKDSGFPKGLVLAFTSNPDGKENIVFIGIILFSKVIKIEVYIMWNSLFEKLFVLRFSLKFRR